MQPDTGLIQNIKHTDQSGPDLRGQADALGLATTQRTALPVEGEIAQAHLDHESQAFANFEDHLAGDPALEIAQGKPTQKHMGLGNGERTEIGDAPTRDPRAGDHLGSECDGQHLRPKPTTAADIAGMQRHVGLQPIAGELALAVRIEPFQIGQDSFEGLARLLGRPSRHEPEVHLVGPGAIHQRAAGLL